MYHVLMPIDAEESRVRSQVDAILGLPNPADELQVDVLYVYEEIDAPGDEAGTTYIDDINRNLEDLQGLPDTIDFAVDRLRDAGVSTAVHDVTGDPASAILKLADEFDVDALVLGTRRRSPVGKALFGSVTQEVILNSNRPVIASPA